MSSLAIPVLRTWSDRTAREYVLPPSLSLDRKRAASANLRHVKIYKKPRVSQQFGQAIKSVIRRKVMMASLTESKSKGGGGGWWLVVGNWWLVVIGGWWWLVVVGGW